MSYPRELLDSAHGLLHSVPETPATLRRAVSTAYYAVFHLLIEDACENWSRAEQRHRLARLFEHRQMYVASDKRVQAFRKSAPGSTESHLYSVAEAFCQLQRNRHKADYDLSAVLSDSDVAVEIGTAEAAFQSWGLVRNEQIAQDYLFSLFRER